MLISDLMTAMHRGQELAHADTWKNRTILLNALTAFLAAALAVAKGLGYQLDVDQQTVENLAAGIVAGVGLFNAIMHCITSTRVGLPPVGGTGGGADSGSGGT